MIKVGVFLDSAAPNIAGREYHQVLEETMHLSRVVDDLGFDGIWFGEHHFTEENYDPAPLIMAAHASAVTRRCMIGTSIVLLPLQHPLHIIEQACLIDQLSGGRFILGVGAGYRLEELAAFDVSRSSRALRMEEGLELFRLYLAGEPFSFSGEYYQIAACAPTLGPFKDRKLPIWVGARGDPAGYRAGRYGFGLLGGTSHVPFHAYQSGLSDAGHDPNTAAVAILRSVHLAESRELAWQRAGAAIDEEVSVARKWYGPTADLPRDGVGRSVPDKSRVRFVGGPEEVTRDVEDLDQRYDPVGLEWLIINPRPSRLDLDLTLDSIERFAEHVLPRVRGES
jgi:alkanesulfonate monooxygenase SsuD/methylene tetrahydromethanopterin reductase-like flavin-dependent oxidoreductase (luciferase family)